MQVTIVAVLMTLVGLGCSNKEDDEFKPAPPESAVTNQDSPQLAPAPVPEPLGPVVNPPPFAGAAPSPEYDSSHSIGRVLHQTIVSFFLGRDCDVMTPKEIEAAFYSGAYSATYEYPPSAVLSQDVPQ